MQIHDACARAIHPAMLQYLTLCSLRSVTPWILSVVFPLKAKSVNENESTIFYSKHDKNSESIVLCARAEQRENIARSAIGYFKCGENPKDFCLRHVYELRLPIGNTCVRQRDPITLVK